MMTVSQWDFFQLNLTGPSTGNPYLEVTLEATFVQGDRRIRVPGFHDGGGGLSAALHARSAGRMEL